MGNRSQRKQQARHQQKLNEQRAKKKQLAAKLKAESVHSPSVRHAQRLQRQSPQAWDGELPEDVALFDDNVLATLPSDLAEQVRVVRTVFEEVLDRRGVESLEPLASIPRSSPLSIWRLFLRGLVAWVEDDLATAADVWRRLDVERRPGRIAISLMAAHRSDLENSPIPSEPSEATADASADKMNVLAEGPWSGPLPSTLRYHAKLVRRTRIDRPALRAALNALQTPEERDDVHVGPNRLAALARFIADHRSIEPALISALSEGVLVRAFHQGFANLFDRITSECAGPPHDPRNWLLRYHYYAPIPDDRRAHKLANEAFDNYVTRDLPSNTLLSAPLRDALRCEMHLQVARELIEIEQDAPGFTLFEPRNDDELTRKHLQAAAQALPTNRDVYQTYSNWLINKLELHNKPRLGSLHLTGELCVVMESWAKHLPTDDTPRQWLVDFYISKEELAKAKPHVDCLSRSRPSDPNVRALPWKWELLEASRLARRKDGLPVIPQRLAEAERLWPDWLSRQWLPYWEEAYALRHSAAATSSKRTRKAEPAPMETKPDGVPEATPASPPTLTQACMRLGAAQWLRVPSSDLKSIRAPVDAMLRDLQSISDDELLDACSFHWDVERTKLAYASFRIQAVKIAKEFLRRVNNELAIIKTTQPNPRVRAALLLAAKLKQISTSNCRKLMNWLRPDKVKDILHCLVAFAIVRQSSFGFLSLDEGLHVANGVREMARSEPDTFYRLWYLSMADQFERDARRAQARQEAHFRRIVGTFGPFGGFGDFGAGDFDASDDDDEEGAFDDAFL